MPIVEADLKKKLSGNGTGNDSIGGAISATDAPTSIDGLFDKIESDESAQSDYTDHRCIYFKNEHGSLTAQNTVVWMSALSSDADVTVSIGVGTASIGQEEQRLANEEAVPAGVVFSQPTSFGSGLSLGNIPFGSYKAVWIERVSAADASASANSAAQLTFRCDTEA